MNKPSPTHQTQSTTEPAKAVVTRLRLLLPFLKPYKLHIFGAIIALIVAAASVLLFGQGLRRVIDTGFALASLEGLTQSILLVFTLVVVLAIATFARFYAVSWLGERLVADLRKAVFSNLLRQSPAFFESTKIGEITSRVTTDTTLIQSVVGSSASIALRNLLLAVGGSIMLLITSLKLTAILFLILPVVLIPLIVFGRRVRRLSKSSQDEIASVSAMTEESLSAIRTVQANTHEAIDRQAFNQGADQAFRVAVSRITARALLVACVMILVFGATCLMFWVGGRDVLLGNMSAGRLAEFVFYAIVVAGAFGAISEVYGELQRAAGATERLSDLLSLEPQIKNPPQALALDANAPTAIEFDKVNFAYPAKPETPALTDLSFTIKKGEHVAIVGPSGAGKSTLFQLILRFYDAHSGTIKVGSTDVKALNLQDLRNQIAWISQDPVLFSSTIADNIAYGKPNATLEQIEQAAVTANVMEFVTPLKDGLNTYVGEKGVRLSGGQKQRIALARAILRDAPILLLDEATASLDTQNEKLVQEALDKTAQNRTTLTIAHRYTTIQNADRVLVFKAGRLNEETAYEDLLAKDAKAVI